MSAQEMARAVGVTPTYLSALERGRRGRASWALLQRIIHHLGVIWDEAAELERLADLSHPRVTVDTAALDATATLLANRLSHEIAALETGEVERLLAILDEAAARRQRIERNSPSRSLTSQP